MKPQSWALHLALATTRNSVYISVTKFNKGKYSETLAETAKGLRSCILMCLPHRTAVRTAVLLSPSGEWTFNLSTTITQLPGDPRGMTRCPEQTDMHTAKMPFQLAIPVGTKHVHK